MADRPRIFFTQPPFTPLPLEQMEREALVMFRERYGRDPTPSQWYAIGVVAGCVIGKREDMADGVLKRLDDEYDAKHVKNN